MSASPARYCMDASSLEPPRSPALVSLQRPHPTAVTASTSQDPLFRTRYALSAYACTTLSRGWHVPVLPPVPLFARVAHRAHPALKAPSPAKEGRARCTETPNGSAWHGTVAPVGPPSPYAPWHRMLVAAHPERVEHAQSDGNVVGLADVSPRQPARRTLCTPG